MRSLVMMSAAVALVASAALVLSVRAADEAPKFKIKEVMKKCMADGGPKLCSKVATGAANDAEKKELVELFTALAANKPPKGEEASWKELTGALVAAAKECAEGKEGGPEKLKKAANCGACHKAHKG